VASTLSVSSSSLPLKDPNAAAFVVDLLPLIRADGVELACAFTITQTVPADSLASGATSAAVPPAAVNQGGVVTNLSVAVECHLPDGTGFGLLSPVSTNFGRRVLVLGSLSVQRGRRALAAAPTQDALGPK